MPSDGRTPPVEPALPDGLNRGYHGELTFITHPADPSWPDGAPARVNVAATRHGAIGLWACPVSDLDGCDLVPFASRDVGLLVAAVLHVRNHGTYDPRTGEHWAVKR